MASQTRKCLRKTGMPVVLFAAIDQLKSDRRFTGMSQQTNIIHVINL